MSRWIMVFAAWLTLTVTASAQGPWHYLNKADMPPGVIGLRQLERGGPLAGYFQPGEDVNYITLTTEKASDDQPFRTIFHEYVHLLVANTMGATVPA